MPTRELTFRDLISKWATLAEFSRDIGASYEAARKMYDRDSIADSYWTPTVDAARKHNIRNSSGRPLEVSDLATMKAARRKRAELRRRRASRDESVAVA